MRLVLFLLLLATVSASIYNPAFGWRLDNSTGYNDIMGWTHLTNSGAVYNSSCGLTIDGRAGCWRFDGLNDVMTSANSTAGNIFKGGNFTITAWVSASNKDNDATGYMILSARKSAGPLNNWHWYSRFYGANQQSALWVSNVQKDTQANSGQLAYGTWQFLTVTYNKTSQKMQLYINGTEASAYTKQDLASSGDLDGPPIYLGSSGFSSEWFKGQVKWVWGYKRVLSKQDMILLMNTNPLTLHHFEGNITVSEYSCGNINVSLYSDMDYHTVTVGTTVLNVTSDAFTIDYSADAPDDISVLVEGFYGGSSYGTVAGSFFYLGPGYCTEDLSTSTFTSMEMLLVIALLWLASMLVLLTTTNPYIGVPAAIFSCIIGVVLLINNETSGYEAVFLMAGILPVGLLVFKGRN